MRRSLARAAVVVAALAAAVTSAQPAAYAGGIPGTSQVCGNDGGTFVASGTYAIPAGIVAGSEGCGGQGSGSCRDASGWSAVPGTEPVTWPCHGQPTGQQHGDWQPSDGQASQQPTTPAPSSTTNPKPARQSGDLVPQGVTGAWRLAFDDEFSGTSVDTSRWAIGNGAHVNNVTDSAANVSESGGDLNLQLSGPSTGAVVCSGGTDTPCGGSTSDGYALPVGGYAEARIWFPGSGTTVDNWPAWWVSGANWPAAGEADIAEGLGDLTVNYHSPSGSHNHGTVAGTWSAGWHVYGIWRHNSSDDVYWDGKLVKSFPTDDNGQPEALILDVGSANTAVYGPASDVKVDYVRVWSPA